MNVTDCFPLWTKSDSTSKQVLTHQILPWTCDTCIKHQMRLYVCHQNTFLRVSPNVSQSSRLTKLAPLAGGTSGATACGATLFFLPPIFVAKLIPNRLQIDSIQIDPGWTPDRPKEPERVTSKTETMSGEMEPNSSPSQFGTPCTRLRTQRCLSRRVERILSCLING